MPITNQENQCFFCKQHMISNDLRGKIGGAKICLDCAFRILQEAGVIKLADKKYAQKARKS